MARSSEVEVIVVGNELLKGESSDAHLAFIGRSMLTVGVGVGGGHVVGDDQTRIAALVRDRMQDTRVLLVCGGLGPTHDDVTREGVADAVGMPLEFREEQWHEIQAVFERTGRRADESNRRQALLPSGAEPIPNPAGTAPGFSLEKDNCLVVVLPGPPKELNPMIEGVVLPLIDEIFQHAPTFVETFRTTGIAESMMTPVVEPIFDRFKEFAFASLPHIGGVDVVITGRPKIKRDRLEKRAAEFEAELREVLGSKVYGKGAVTLGAVIGEELARRQATLSIVESVTGGLVGKQITDVPGSSRYFLADVVAYSNEDKVRFLGVNKESIEEHGAVSEVVCCEMAVGGRSKTGSTFGLATTGVAGPEGGTRNKPVGLCFYGLTWEGGAAVRKRIFPGTRADIRERVAYAALFLLWEQLQRM